MLRKQSPPQCSPTLLLRTSLRYRSTHSRSSTQIRKKSQRSHHCCSKNSSCSGSCGSQRACILSHCIQNTNSVRLSLPCTRSHQLAASCQCWMLGIRPVVQVWSSQGILHSRPCIPLGQKLDLPARTCRWHLGGSYSVKASLDQRIR